MSTIFLKKYGLYIVFYLCTLLSSSLVSQIILTSIHIDKETVGEFGYARAWFEPRVPWMIDPTLCMVKKHKDKDWKLEFFDKESPVISYTGERFLFFKTRSINTDYCQSYFLYRSSSNLQDVMIVPIAKVTKRNNCYFVDSFSCARDSKEVVGFVPVGQEYSEDHPYFCSLHIKFKNGNLVCKVSSTNSS